MRELLGNSTNCFVLARMQITLNETCEKLEDVNSRVKCLEGDMASLKEELVQQRSSFAEDKLSLQDLLVSPGPWLAPTDPCL